MRDYKSIFKRNLIIYSIILSLIIGFGVFLGVVSFLGLLNHLGVVKTGWTIDNFTWFNFSLLIIVVFCLVFFPFKTILKQIQRYKELSTLALEVQEEYQESLKNENEEKCYEKTTDLKEETLNQIEQEKENLDGKAKNKQMIMPPFAGKNRKKYAIATLIGLVVVVAIGLKMIIDPQGNKVTGWLAVILGVVFTYFYTMQVLVDFKGKKVSGKLLQIQGIHLSRGRKERMIVAYKGKIKAISFPNWQEYFNVCLRIAKGYVGKEIPLKVFGGYMNIDWVTIFENENKKRP